MKYMLDTNICIYIIKKKPDKVIRHLRELRLSDLCISSITLSELEYGVEKSEQRDRNKIALAKFIAPIEVLLMMILPPPDMVESDLFLRRMVYQSERLIC